MIGKKLAVRAGLTTALATAAAMSFAVSSVGSAHAAVGADWVGWGETNHPHAVWCVQQLIDDSPAPAYAYPDGKFGQQTYTAIQEFQTWAQGQGWDTGGTDGVVGPSTGEVLLDSFPDGYDNYCYSYLPTMY